MIGSTTKTSVSIVDFNKIHVFAAVLIWLFFITPEVNSQQLTVKDQKSGAPIEGVVVYTVSFISQTNHLGQVSIGQVPGSSVLSFYHPSYLPFSAKKTDLGKMSYAVVMTESPLRLDEVVVSVSRQKLLKSHIPNKVDVVTSSEIGLATMPTTADMAGLSGEVYVQKSQQGGGSPMLRGFSANRLLLVVDGFRMNNAIFRSGNLQNIVSVDPASLESIEVLPGPGSVIYGSDALGGVLSLSTIRPEFNYSGKVVSERMILLKSASANSEKTIHGRWKTSGLNWGFLLGGSYSGFDDLMMGKNGPAEFTRPEYVVPGLFNGKDTILKNDNNRLQRFSGYDQLNLMAKVRLRVVKNVEINLGTLYSRISDVPRYDRLIVYKGNRLRYGEWYYGPQTWLLNSATLSYNRKNLLFDGFTLLSGIQSYVESRHDRNIDSPDLYHRSEKLSIFSASIDFTKTIESIAVINYGLEKSAERIRSKGETENLISGLVSPVAPRYPDRSKYRNMAAYVHSRYNITDKVSLHGGMRFTHTYLEGDFPLRYYDFPVEGFQSGNRAVNGNIGMVFHPSPGEKLNLLFSSGFRSPNMDDMAKVFDSEPGHVMVPNPDLEPEYAYNLEAGYAISRGNKIQSELTIFYTWLSNAMVRRDFLFNGRDSILYNQVMSKVESLVNTDGAVIYGSTFSFALLFSDHLKSRHTITWIRGKDSDGLPVRHVPPLYGSSSIVWEKLAWTAELNVRYNGRIPYSRLATDERDKPYLYLPDDKGNPFSPGWYTLNMSVNYDITDQINFTGGIENLLNKRYRPYSSGIVAAGRSLILSVSLEF